MRMARWLAAHRAHARIRIGVCVLTLALQCLGVPRASGQSGAAVGGLTLSEVLARTLADSPAIAAAEQGAEIEKGLLLSAAGPFDIHVGTWTTGAQEGTTHPMTGLDAMARQLTYGLSVSKRFRQGPIITQEVSAAGSAFSAAPGLSSNRASLRLNVLVPLANDRGAILTAAVEHGAQLRYDASVVGLRQAKSDAVRAALASYWEYVAAQRRLAVYQSSERRAERTATDTKSLVGADERTQADLTQVLGHVASKRVQRLNAEQALTVARSALGLAMGLAADKIAGIPAAATEFPALSPATGCTAPERLLSVAIVRRDDLIAADLDLRSAQAFVDAAQNNLKPNVDVTVGIGYTGLQPTAGLDTFLSTFYRNVPGVDFAVQLRHQRSLANLDARGRVLEAGAVREQHRIARDDLKRRIAADVAVACEALARGAQSVGESATAVALLESSVENEQRRFQLGVSTLFDVIQAQDALTSAMLADIGSRRDYAMAIAWLRTATGTLLTHGPGGPTVDAAAALTPP